MGALFSPNYCIVPNLGPIGSSYTLLRPFLITWDSQSTSYSQPRTPWIQPGSPMTQPRFPHVDASKIFFELLLAFFFHRNFTPEIHTNRKSYTGKYYNGKYTYWKMIHRNFVTQELLYRNLSYTGKTNPEKVRPDN